MDDSRQRPSRAAVRSDAAARLFDFSIRIRATEAMRERRTRRPRFVETRRKLRIHAARASLVGCRLKVQLGGRTSSRGPTVMVDAEENGYFSSTWRTASAVTS